MELIQGPIIRLHLGSLVWVGNVVDKVAEDMVRLALHRKVIIHLWQLWQLLHMVFMVGLRDKVVKVLHREQRCRCPRRDLVQGQWMACREADKLENL